MMKNFSSLFIERNKMNGKVYKDISDELQRRRTKAMLLADQRKEEIYSSIPRVESIDEEIRRIGIRLGLMAIKGNADKEELEYNLNKLINEKNKLIKDAGYSINYLDDVFECKSCKDTGYIFYNDEYIKCGCYKRLLIDRLIQDSNVSYQGGSFNDFDLSLYPDTIDIGKYGIKSSPRSYMEGNLDRCKDFVDNFTRRKVDNLLFVGKSGLGKTHLCNSIALALLEKGIPVLYLNAPSMFSAITSVYSKDEQERENAKQIYDLIINTELLIIDDLGTERQTATRYTELLEILNARELISKKRTCKTIISTNLDTQNIFKFYGERVASRIMGCFEVLLFVGEDVRIKFRRCSI